MDRPEVVRTGHLTRHRGPYEQAFHAWYRHSFGLCDLRSGCVALHTRLACWPLTTDTGIPPYILHNIIFDKCGKECSAPHTPISTRPSLD